MKKTIWKYELEIKDRIQIDMPKGAWILTLQVQNGIPCIWALVDPSEQTIPRHFRIIGTGHHEYPSELRLYVGSFQLSILIFHVFEYYPMSSQDDPDPSQT